MDVGSRNRIGFLGAAALVALLSAPAAWAEAAKPSFGAAGKLSICTTAGFPPMTYLENPSDQRPVGIDIDIADALGKLWSAEIKFSTSGFDGLLPSLASGRCDLVISGIYLNDKRRESYDGVPYLKSSVAIVTLATNEEIKVPEDLSGKRLALEAGTTYAEVPPVLNAKLEKEGRKPVAFSTYESQVAAAQQVMIGRADATLTEVSEASVRIKQTGGQLKIAYTYPPEGIYGIYIRKNPDDLKILRAAMKQLEQSGVIGGIAKKYNMPSADFAVDHDS
ncbi:MAG: transporter substrate-binding domain-containing protein [Parvibaculaceae bacterium]